MVPDHADPPRGLTVRHVSLRDYRSYERLDLELSPGLVLVVGPNGAGKTNLLEALHVGTQGFSPRTRADLQLIRFGADAARVSLRGEREGFGLETEIALRRGESKQARLNGVSLRAAEQLRSELPTLVFTPDRLAVVKSGPAVRRAYFDRTLGRLFPARSDVPLRYGEALGQRNACLRKAAAGFSSHDALAPWTEQVLTLGSALQRLREETLAVLSPKFSEAAAALGLPSCRLEYVGEPLTAEALERRLVRDLERGTTGLGPHLDEISVLADTRDLRIFGSQGEQRIAVLALLLAEAELLAETAETSPLLLLDDVLSELDLDRRLALVAWIGRVAQTVVTATSERSLPLEPSQLVRVEPGIAEVA